MEQLHRFLEPISTEEIRHACNDEIQSECGMVQFKV